MHLFKIITPSKRTEGGFEINRWKVERNLNQSSLDELIKRLQQIFGTRSAYFYISWFDGSDYCTVRDHCDLIQAAEFFEDSGTNDKAIRIYASLEQREHNTIFGGRPEETVKPMEPETPVFVEEVHSSDDYTDTSDSEGEDVEPTIPDEPVVDTMPTPEPEATVLPRPEPIPSVVPMQQPMMYPGYMAPEGMMQPYYVPYPIMQPFAHPHGGITQPQMQTLQPINQQPPEAAANPLPPAPPYESAGLKSGKKPVRVGRTNTKQIIQTLRMMGFKQEDKTLKKVIKSHKGDMNLIVEQLRRE